MDKIKPVRLGDVTRTVRNVSRAQLRVFINLNQFSFYFVLTYHYVLKNGITATVNHWK